MTPSKYTPLDSNEGLRESDDDVTSLLEKAPIHEKGHWHRIGSLGISLAATTTLVIYTLAIAWITKAALRAPSHRHHVVDPASSYPHPDEKEYIITETGRHDEEWLHHLVYGKPSPEVDEAWYDLLKPFNTRVPAERYEAMMPGRPTVRLADGSGDYYVTLTFHHELHCLMRFRWFLEPGYYANMTWEEQASNAGLMGHYRHCLWSLLESVICNGDTSMRTFHWDPIKPKPIPDSPAERKCVNWAWLYEWTTNHSFLLQERKLSHPKFGLLDEKLMPVKTVTEGA